MSVCDEGWGDKDCPCFIDVRAGWCTLGVWGTYVSDPPDSCPFAPVLKALPTATPEQVEAATRVLTGKDNHWDITNGSYPRRVTHHIHHVCLRASEEEV